MRFRDTGIRYYENDEIIIITALKVATRYCDKYFHNDDLSKVKEICINVEPNMNDRNFYMKFMNDEGNPILDKKINNIINGKFRKKVIFLCRNPLKRHTASVNHFFEGYVKLMVNNKIKIRNKVKNSELEVQIKDSVNKNHYNELIQDKLLWISENNFKVLYNSVEGNWPKYTPFNMKKIPSDVMDVLRNLAINYIKYENKKKWENVHYSSYLKMYDRIINSKNINKIRILDIDKENISKELKGLRNKQIHKSQYKSNTKTKPMIEKLIKESNFDFINSETIIYNKLMNL
jgi:hypothetical protein